MILKIMFSRIKIQNAYAVLLPLRVWSAVERTYWDPYDAYRRPDGLGFQKQARLYRISLACHCQKGLRTLPKCLETFSRLFLSPLPGLCPDACIDTTSIFIWDRANAFTAAHVTMANHKMKLTIGCASEESRNSHHFKAKSRYDFLISFSRAFRGTPRIL